MGSYEVNCIRAGVEDWHRVAFPNGSRMIYVEVPGDESHRNHHSYWRAHPDWSRGQRIAGASSMVSTFDLKQDALHKWIGRQAATSGDFDPGREKRELGSRVHGVAEALASGVAFPNVDEMPESDRGYVRALMRWWEERRPEVIATEQFVFHGDLGYAGRYDLRARIDGKEVLLDLKTANNLYPKYGAQLVAYDLAAEWCGLGKADELRILKVCEDGDWFEVPAFVERDELLNAMAVRKVSGRVRAEQTAYIRAVSAERVVA